MDHYQQWDSGYSKEQSTRPQTVGYGLVDSPAGAVRLDRGEVLGLDRLRRPPGERADPGRAARQRHALLAARQPAPRRPGSTGRASASRHLDPVDGRRRLLDLPQGDLPPVPALGRDAGSPTCATGTSWTGAATSPRSSSPPLSRRSARSSGWCAEVAPRGRRGPSGGRHRCGNGRDPGGHQAHRVGLRRLHGLREGGPSRGHMEGEHLSGALLRRPLAPLFVLVRPQPRVEPRVRARRRDRGLPRGRRPALRRARRGALR